MKFAQVIAAALAVLLLLTQQVWAVDLSATAAVLMDCDTGQILYQKNADKRMRVASTTKILTALVVLEECGLRQEVTVMQRHMAEGSSMYLKPGERVTVETLLYGLLLCSGNDAALALADACGGEKQCIRRMNDLAGRIGMNSSHFENPNGLDGETHYSTARDMAKLAAYGAKNPTLMRICSTIAAQTGGRSMKNHNRLLRELVDLCQEEGSIHPSYDPDCLVEDLVVLHRGTLFEWRIYQEGFDIAKQGRRMADALLWGWQTAPTEN